MVMDYTRSIDIDWYMSASGVAVSHARPRSMPRITSFTPEPLTESSASEQSKPSPLTESHSTALVPEIGSSDALIHRLREDLLQIGGVEHLYIARDRDTIDVWTIIPRRDLNLVRRIAEAERTITRDYVSRVGSPAFFFDFHTLYRGHHNPTDLIPMKAIELTRM